MKKFNLKLAATVMVCGAFLFSSCIGSFGLHSKLLNWNQGIGNKFVNELVFLAFNIIPVYGVCYLADALVINSIEFWSGSNPMASVGDVKKVKGENGNYLVETLENGYSITKEGETASMELIYDKDLNTWNVVADGVSTELLQMNNDGTAQITLPNGEDMTVTLDAQGISAARQATMVNNSATACGSNWGCWPTTCCARSIRSPSGTSARWAADAGCSTPKWPTSPASAASSWGCWTTSAWSPPRG